MKASKLIEHLERKIEEHGDLHVVSGMKRTGYGELVYDIVLETEGKTLGGGVVPVFDLIMEDTSFVAHGGF